jgi:hypothetical protein
MNRLINEEREDSNIKIKQFEVESATERLPNGPKKRISTTQLSNLLKPRRNPDEEYNLIFPMKKWRS